MRKTFTLFQSHLDLAHRYWSELLSVGDHVIDATCGNGRDTVILATLGAKTYSIDIQQNALNEAKLKVESKGIAQLVTFIKGCHSKFPEEIESHSVKLIVYNLGYLPGGNKDVTTQVTTTLKSLEHALDLLVAGGMISITCYPGHEEGKREEEQLLYFCQNLSPREWSCCHHRWINRKLSPSLIILQKINV